MSDNKFIKHLRGEDTAKSVLEVKNQRTTTSFANMPDGDTSNANDVYSDHRGNATGVLKGAENWKLDGQNLVETTTVYGDGRDFTDSFSVFGNGLWVDATYTFATARRFSPNTKFVLKLCGHDLETVINHTVDFTLIVKFGVSTLISKTFTVTEQAFNFCKEFVIDFAESNSSTIKADAGSTMQVQLLCADANARAVLYNGMTVFTALQRRVDGDVVASDTKTFSEVVDQVDQIQEDLDNLEEYVDDTFVRLDGNSIMTGPLKFEAGSMRGAISGYLNGVAFWKMSAQHTITNIANLTDSQFLPVTTNSIDIGRSANKWKDLYLAGTAYITKINNGYDIAVPVTNSADTLALKSEVDLAANSGRMITDQGVWFAKMYSATVAPSAENGTNYADFSQVDGQGNPIIVIYNRVNGVWVQDQTITPPAEYDGYVPITSKIWDIAEQTGQQGGRILWNHQSKEFTPYPQIISFDGQSITNSTFSGGTIINSTFSGTATLSGASTVVIPQDPTGDQIVNKDYVDNHIPTGNFYHPDLFDWKWADRILDDVQWLRADTFSWQSGSVYQAAFDELFYDIQISTYWYGGGGPAYTKSRTPAVGDAVYLNSDLTTQIGTVEAYDDVNDEITVSGNTYTFMSNTYVTPTTEIVARHSVSVYTGHSGRKIVNVSDETNVANIYTATGVAWYYIIDIPNKRFKLPRRHSQQIVRSVKNVDGSWYRLYADGWVEQGGQVTQATTSQQTLVFPVEMSDANYQVLSSVVDDNLSNYVFCVQVKNKTVTGFDTQVLGSYQGGTATSGYNFVWQVSGQSAIDMSSFQGGEKYLYFYVGEFTQAALENTAGLNAELFNDKADTDLANVLANIDFVVEKQEPTAGNNYTWYRKYRSGWVEQGGYMVGSSATVYTVNLPITMANTNYTVMATLRSNTVSGGGGAWANANAYSTTQIQIVEDYKDTWVGQGSYWTVSGMAA